MNPLFLIV